jgi:hypothetical protein
VAVRKAGAVSYLFGDHLGSTSVTANASGTRTGELWYKPWGESRGMLFGTTPTTHRFTGQRENTSIALYFYGARYYDAYEAGGAPAVRMAGVLSTFYLGTILAAQRWRPTVPAQLRWLPWRATLRLLLTPAVP